MVDLDQGGNTVETARVYFGPSLGWVQTQVRPSQTITTGGVTVLPAGSSLVLVNVAALVTIMLPDVRAWLKESAYNPATAFDRSIWIKDIGGHASSFNIIVDGFMNQQIDLQFTYSIITSFTMLRLYPLFDQTGWFVG